MGRQSFIAVGSLFCPLSNPPPLPKVGHNAYRPIFVYTFN